MDTLNKTKILLVIFLTTVSVEAATTIKVTWKEKNKHIAQNSVCADYKNIPRQYRYCRIEAKSLFKKRCEKSRARLEKSKKAQRYKNAYSKDKYCYAAKTFMVYGY